MTTDPIILVGDTQREFARQCVDIAPLGHWVTIKEPARTQIQNRKLWPMLTDIVSQVDWYGQSLDAYAWKDMFVASLRKANVVPGIDGGFVTTGLGTSSMGKSEFADLITLIYAFGDERGVMWSEPIQVPE